MRLAERILIRPVLGPSDAQLAATRVALSHALTGRLFVSIDVLRAQQRAARLPCRPPWPITWLETVLFDHCPHLEVGALVRPDGAGPSLMAAVFASIDLDDGQVMCRRIGKISIATDACWIPRHDACLDVPRGDFRLDDSIDRSPGDILEFLSSASLDLITVTLGLLGVRNIQAPEEPESRQLRRHRERRGEPRFSFRVLRLDPRLASLPGRDPGESGLERALHLVRGHFADHRELGLFGRSEFRGMFWRPAHLRGSAEAGRIRKDYSLERP